MPNPPLILTALELEAAAIRRRLPSSSVARVLVIGPAASAMPAEIPESGLILVAGIGGGLDPALRTGDVIIDGDVHPPPGARAGRIHTAGHVVETPAQKAALYAETGADAVDMEQAIVRASLGDRVVGVRAISDTAAHTLPGFLARFVTPDGRTNTSRAAAHLLGHPQHLPAMLTAARLSSIACRALGEAVSGIVAPNAAP
ncbi:MAG: hypothetical protein AAFR38_07935 [Planctomycetota bacterium]